MTREGLDVGSRGRLMISVGLLAAFMTGFGLLQPPPTRAGDSQSAQLVHVADDLLTVDIRDAPLKELLEEVARQSGLDCPVP